MFALIILKAEGIVVRFISKRQKIDLQEWFCKQCFYHWPPDSEDPPERCANTRGYINDAGESIPPCKSRKWDKWPDDFNPATCTSKIALSVYYQEQAEDEKDIRQKSA